MRKLVFLLLPTLAFSRTFTLKEAIGYGLLHNRKLLAEDKQIEAREKAIGKKLAMAKPKLSVSFQASRVNTVATFGGRSTRTKTSQEGTLQFLYPLYQFGKEDIEVDVARREVEVEFLERMRLEREVTFDIKEAFYKVYLAQKTEDVLRREVKQAQQFLEITQKKFKAGALPFLELTRAEVHLKEKEKELEKALHDKEIAKANLRHQMGYPQDEPIAVSLELEDPLLPDLDTSTCVKQALQLRPEIRRLELELRNNEEGIKLAKRAPFPETNFFSNFLFQKGSAFRPDSSYEIGILLKADIYDGGFSKSTLEELRQQAESLKQKAEDTKEKVALEVGLRILDVKEAYTQFQLAREQKHLAEQLHRVQKSRFDAGFGIPLEVLDAQNRLLSARIGLERSITQFYLALEALEKAAGDRCWQ